MESRVSHEGFRAHQPRHSPTWQAESLCKTVYDYHVIIVDILDVLSSTDDGAVAVVEVVVAAIKLVHDQGRSLAAKVLNFGKLRVRDDLSRWIPCAKWPSATIDPEAKSQAGIRGLEVRIIPVPREISSATLSA